MRYLLLLLALSGCGVTQWQRDQDIIQEALRDLNSPEMDRKLEEARNAHP